jgi:hypothetical protein
LLRSTVHAYGTIKSGSDIHERQIAPIVRALADLYICSELSEREGRDIFKRHWSLSDIRAQKILSLNVLMSH